MTYAVTFTVERPKGVHTITTNVAGCADPAAAEAKIRALYPGVLKVKKVEPMKG